MSLSREVGPFRQPRLHLVIAEDQDDWGTRLRASFEEYIADWGFYTTGQFRIDYHRCKSVESFERTMEKLLKQGELVYATVDLKMPRRDGDDDDPNSWKQLVVWCLDQKKQDPEVDDRFEFCVISGQEHKMRQLTSHPDHGDELRRRGITKAFKDEIECGSTGEIRLRAIWDQVKEFVLRRLKFCTLPLAAGEPSRQTMIWFGDHEWLARLRSEADQIATSPRGGLYLLFADAGGYEVDWFRLVCLLRGVQAPKILNIAHITPESTSDWEEKFREPPEALLVSHVDRAADNQCDIVEAMTRNNFLAKIEEARRLAFIQFPYFERLEDIGDRLDKEERAIHDFCTRAVHAEASPDRDSGFAFRSNKRIIKFPSYDALRGAGVVRRTIDFQVEQNRERNGLAQSPLDPEMSAVLEGIRWDEGDGISSMRLAIDRAYERARNETAAAGRHVGIEHFRSNVRDKFASPLGFTIRGRRLFEVLDQNKAGARALAPGPANEADRAAVALSDLEATHDLFDSLARLVHLKDELEEAGKLTFQKGAFPLDDFEALKSAHEFLVLIFGSPEALLRRIEDFRRHVGSPRWEHYVPSLRDREDLAELVENIRFTWPYARFRLPPAVFDFLGRSAYIAEIHAELGTVLARYPALKVQWDEVEARRTDLLKELQSREEQRHAAVRYAREQHTQPALVLLEPVENGRMPSFTLLLQALCHFNANLAICEQHYLFDWAVGKKSKAKEALTRGELGPNINLLCGYLVDLRAAGRLKESLFRGWDDGWPVRGKQTDAPRLAAEIVASILGKHPGAMKPDHLVALGRIRDAANGCPTEGLLESLGALRNRFDKATERRFWEQHQEDLTDLLRRFVAATTRDTLRIGRVSPDGRRAQLWARNKMEDVDLPTVADKLAGRDCAFVGPHHHPLFPIDDLIRLNPPDCAVWVYSRGSWVDSTNDGMRDERERELSPGPDFPWLPSPERFQEHAVWKAIHGK
jgi:hypothetical protein